MLYLKKIDKNIPITTVNRQASKGKRKNHFTHDDTKTLKLIENYRKEHEIIIYEYPPKGEK